MPSFGEDLRRERELRQISLREVAEATKISLRYLEAMERNDFAGLPGGVFNRGFVRAYCQYIGVDPEGMVNSYLLEEKSQSVPGDRNARPPLLRGQPSAVKIRFAAGAERAAEERARRRRALLRWGLLLVVLLGLAVCGYLYVRVWREGASRGQLEWRSSELLAEGAVRGSR
jgi:cytoskeletal protein RodZ